MAKPSPKDDDRVVIWENTKADGYNSRGCTHFDTERGGYMMKKGRSAHMTPLERAIRGAPPSHVKERLVSKEESERIKKEQG